MKHFRIALIISVLIISFLVILLTGCSKSSYKLTNSNISKGVALQSRETPTKNRLGKSLAIGFLMVVTAGAFIAIARQINNVDNVQN